MFLVKSKRHANLSNLCCKIIKLNIENFKTHRILTYQNKVIGHSL